MESMRQALQAMQESKAGEEDVPKGAFDEFERRVNIFLSEKVVALSPEKERELFVSDRRDPHRVVLSVRHEFQEHTFKKPTWDNFTGDFIVGLHKQGFRCKSCRANVANKPEALELSKGSMCIGQVRRGETTILFTRFVGNRPSCRMISTAETEISKKDESFC